MITSLLSAVKEQSEATGSSAILNMENVAYCKPARGGSEKDEDGVAGLIVHGGKVAKVGAEVVAHADEATEENYTLKYVFGQEIEDCVVQWLIDMGIEVWYIDDSGQRVRWVLDH